MNVECYIPSAIEDIDPKKDPSRCHAAEAVGVSNVLKRIAVVDHFASNDLILPGRHDVKLRIAEMTGRVYYDCPPLLRRD